MSNPAFGDIIFDSDCTSPEDCRVSYYVVKYIKGKISAESEKVIEKMCELFSEDMAKPPISTWEYSKHQAVFAAILMHDQSAFTADHNLARIRISFGDQVANLINSPFIRKLRLRALCNLNNISTSSNPTHQTHQTNLTDFWNIA